MSELYFKKALTSMEPYDPEIHDDTWLTVNRVSISEHDRANGSPKIGDMIASNPKARDDKWLVNEKYLKENYELDTRPDDAKADELDCRNSRCSYYNRLMEFHCERIDEQYHTRCDIKLVNALEVCKQSEVSKQS